MRSERSFIKSFTIASSLPITLLPLAALGLAAALHGADINFVLIAVVIPAVFGFYHATTIALGLPLTRKAFIYAGLFLGLLLSGFGTLVLNIPCRVYGLEGDLRYLAMIAGPFLYAALWSLVLWPLQRKLSEPASAGSN